MIKFLTPILILFLLASCYMPQKQPVHTTLPARGDGQYDSEFPSAPTSPYLDRIVKSVKMISILTFYKGYEFLLKDSITWDQIRDGSFKQKAFRQSIYERPAAGTATAILQSDKDLLFLTCAHVVLHKDTSVIYYASKDNPKRSSKYIYSVSIKMREISTLISTPRASQPKIIAADKDKDLALVSVTLVKRPILPMPVFHFPFGRSAQLHWGTFVYLIGYPKGKLLITPTVVSSPNRDSNHGFLLNATLARGISGGIVLALRDGPPHFELVGIANALNAQVQYYLKPEFKAKDTFVDMEQPYRGRIYLGQRLTGNANIVFSIAAETVVDFIRKNIPKIKAEGFKVPSDFPRQAP